MSEIEGAPTPKRGTALLIITLILLTLSVVVVIAPRNHVIKDTIVKVAVIDSGISINNGNEIKIIGAQSFVNQSYGYSTDDNSTEDSNPNGSPHGSYVASIIIKKAPFVGILNAKVVSSDNIATQSAIIAAIQWAVRQDCDIINLSLGGSPSENDPLKEVIQWAFYQGVTIVAAAGNNGQEGVSGSSIETPAVYPEVIAVAGVDEIGRPYGFSGRGPIIGRGIKPDISALGSYMIDGGKAVYGTSFAAPRITAGAAQLISSCIQNGWRWTPGMIKAVLMASAQKLSSEPWEVGSGLIDVESALRYLEDAPKRDSLPLVAWVTNDIGPYDFERWFVNTTMKLKLTAISSDNVTFSIFYSGSGSPWVKGPTQILVIQVHEFVVNIKVIADQEEDVQALISFDAEDYMLIHVKLSFTAHLPFAKVAFDVSHTNWWIDSMYGQFRSYYSLFCEKGIAVEELKSPSEITFQRLQEYDVVIVLDPCAWIFESDGSSSQIVGSINYSSEELAAYEKYWNAGGSLFIVGLANYSINIDAANDLLQLFNASFNYDMIPTTLISVGGIISTVEVTGLAEHKVTQGVESFDFVGCSLNYSGNTYEIAWTQMNVRDDDGKVRVVNKTVIVGLESNNGSRLIVSGSNFFIDNWALNNKYHSTDNRKFALQIIYWLVGLY